MIRRPRFSLKPNIRPGGRGPGAPAGASTDPRPEPSDFSSQHVSESPVVCGSPGAVKGEAQTPEEKPKVHSEKETISSNETQQAKVTPPPFQRRKRISTLPNLAKPRVSNSSSAGTPSQKPSSVETPTQASHCALVKSEVTPPEKPKPQSSPRSPPHVPLQGQHSPLPDKKTPVPLIPQFSPHKKPALKQQDVPPLKVAESTSVEELSPLKERPSQESSSNGEPTYRTKSTPVKRIAGDLERERLRRAQKLRDLLRDELRKERRVRKEKHPVIDTNLEPERSKMTMRDFIHFIPVNNPMSSSIEERRNSEKSPSPESQLSVPEAKTVADEDDDLDEVENDSQLVVPRVKVAEDGSIILDEESLTVEVIRAKPAIVEENDPIFERGSTTTYSSFRKNNHSKPWSDQETEMFFLAISMVGTDFSMIGQLFPHRERIEIKNKFKREERANGWRIDKAFREKKAFDFDFFAKLLERALAAKNNKQKAPRVKKPREKKTPKPRKKKDDKKEEEQRSSISEGDAVNLSEAEAMDSMTAEKENEESPCLKENPACFDTVPAKKKRKRKKEADTAISEEDKPLKKGAKSRKKNKITSGEEGPASEGVEGPAESEVTENEELVTPEKSEVPERKRRARKRKDDAKVSEKELLPEDGTDMAQITKKSKPRGKRKSVTFEKKDDVEDAVDSSKGAITTSDELDGNGEDSILLFSDCESLQGTEPFASTRMSPSDDPTVEVPQASELTIHDESVSTSPRQHQEPTNGQESASEAIDLLTGTNTESAPKGLDSPIKDTKAKAPLPARGRLSKLKPNLANLSGKERSAVKVKSSSDVKTDASRCCEDVPVISDAGGAKSSESDTMTEKAETESESLSAKPTPMARGRLQRPKPNLTKSSARKPSTAEEKHDIQEATLDHSNNISLCHKESPFPIEKHQDKEMNVSGHSSQDETVPVSAPHPSPEHSRPADSEQPLSQTSDSTPAHVGQENTAMGDSDKEKLPDQSVRRGLLRPKPNLAKAPARSKPPGQPQTSEQKDLSGQVSGEAGIATLSVTRVETAGSDKKAEAAIRIEESPASEDERKQFAIKPTSLARSRFQKPKPNLTRTPTRSGNHEKKPDAEEQNNEPSAGHASRTSPCDKDAQDTAIKEGNQSMDVTVKEGVTLDPPPVPTPSEACSSADGSPEDLDQDDTPGKSWSEESSLSQDKRVKSPVIPRPLACGRFSGPKPNLGRTCARTAKPNVELGVPSTKPGADDSSHSSHSLGNRSSTFEKHDDQEREVPKGDNCAPHSPSSISFHCKSPESSISETGQLELGQSGPEDPVKVSILEEASLKPEPATQPIPIRGRLQRPKPNLQKASAKRGALAPTGAAKDDVSMAEKTMSPHGPVSVEDASERKQALPSNVQRVKDSPPAFLKPAVLKRGRFQGQNLTRTAVKKDLSELGSSSDGENKEMGQRVNLTESISNNLMCEEVKSTLKCTLSDETQNIQFTQSNDVSIVVEDVQDESVEGDKLLNKDVRETASKPAEPRRGRLIRPKPNLGRAASRKESREEGDAEKRPTIELAAHSHKEAGKERLSDNENPLSDISVSSPAKKSKACASATNVSPKKRPSSITERGQESSLENTSTESREPPKNLSRTAQMGLSAGQQTIIPSIEVDSASTGGEPESNTTQRTRYGRQLKKPVIPSLAVSPKASENKPESAEKEKSVRSSKTSIGKNKPANSVSKTSKGKTTLVTLRASREDEEEEEDVEAEFEDEDYDRSPDRVNQAPAFVPFSLRSPKPVPSEIEETVEEADDFQDFSMSVVFEPVFPLQLEIPVEIVEVQSIPEHEQYEGTEEHLHLLSVVQASSVHMASPSRSDPHNADHIDGSTEAAMTLISMGNHTFQTREDTLETSVELTDLKTPSEQVPAFLISKDQDCQGGVQCARSDAPSIALGGSDNLDDAPSSVILMQCLQSESADSCLGVQSVHPVDRSCGGQFEQVMFPGIRDPEPCGSVSQNDDISGRMDKSGSPAEETTFILTLVEIPLNAEYQYSQETFNPELPAPVLVNAASIHTDPSPESQSPGTSAGTEASTRTLRKRRPSSSSGEETGPLKKKVLLQESLQEKPPTETENTESTSAAASCREISLQTADIQSEAVTLPADTTKEEEPAPPSAGGDSLGSTVHLPTELSALPSKTSLTRPGRKPLGILGLVCQEKGKRKAKDVKRKKKAPPKPPCKKPSQSAHKSKCEVLVPDKISSPSNKVPSLTTCAPSDVPVDPAVPVDVTKPVCEDSDNQDSNPQEPLSSHEDISEEEVSAVSEYFFDDIFMAVDDD